MERKKNIPKLRFSQFNDEWKLTNIRPYLSEYIERVDSNTTIPILTSSRNGLILQKDYFDNRELSNEGEYGVVPRGYFTYRHMSDDSTFKFNVNTICDRGAVSKEYPVFTTKDMDSNFLLIKLNNSDEFKKFAIEQKQGGTRTRLYFKRLIQLNLTIPSLLEQKKIASFLTSIDLRIQQFSKKKSLLEQFKRGVMQKIFLQEITFKDENGKEFPKWEVKKLIEIVECLDNIRKPLNDSERQKMQGNIPYWGANNIVDHINDFLFDETIILLAEDGGNFNEFKTRPIANISYGKCWVNNHSHVLRSKNDLLLNEFLYYSLVHKNITDYTSGGTRSKLIKSEMLKIDIKIPSIKEQTKIAIFLSAIDKKIEGVNKQLEQTRLWKKGLLQQMFV